MIDVTGLTSDQLKKDTRFDEIGLQSLSVVAFTRRLSRKFPQLSPTFLYDCGKISDVAAYLEDRYDSSKIEAAIAGQPIAANAPAVEVAPPPSPNPVLQDAGADADWPELRPLDEDLGAVHHAEESARASSDIAVIGMQGRFPDAPDLSAFWDNLVAGTDSVREIPEERWPLEGFFEPSGGQRKPGRSYSKWGGFLSDIDCFDAQFFGIAAREAALTDPQERLLLECAWHAMESAALLGERADHLKGSDGYDAGVFVGLTTNSYALLGPDRWRQGDPDIPASMPWSAANRISYCLDLAGPSLTVDTACSSSLVALHLACESLLEGECRVALAGAANLYVHPAKYVQLCQQQMLSPSGHCHSFGEAADGFAPGEGVGVVVLKRLAEAKADGDRILAVIKGTAVNHNGRSNGYTVPKTRSQAKLVRDALKKAGLSAGRIGFIEAHGTGTKLGDPIEVAGLTEVLGGKDDAPACAIASVKSNIGHLESAAGMASLIKTILQLQHKQIAPSLHATPRNPALELERTRFFVPEEPQPWPEPADGGLRAAGISSFGAGGTNGHVVIEEAPAPALSAETAEGPLVFPLSARSPEQLRALGEAMLRDMTGRPEAYDAATLPRLAFTLQCGMRHFEHRLCLIGETAAELEAEFRAFLAGQKRAVSSDPKLQELARAFIASEPVDWRSHWRGKPIPVEPPHYPFARERHWLKPIETARSSSTPAREPDPATEIPTLEEHYIAISHDSSLVADHRIGESPLVPGTAYIAHCLDTIREVLDGQPVTLRDLKWLRPVRAGKTAHDITLRILCSHQEDGVSFELEDVGAPGETCFQGEASIAREDVDASHPSLRDAKNTCTEPVAPETCYAKFENAGMVYGPRFRALDKVWRGDRRFLAEIVRQPFNTEGEGEPSLDPALLDGALHAAAALLDRTDLETPLVPAGLGTFRLHGELGERAFSYGVQQPAKRKGETRYDVYLFAQDGTLLAEFTDLRFRHAPALRSQENADDALYLLQPSWIARPLPAADETDGLVVLFDADDALFQRLKEAHPEFASRLRLVTAGHPFEVHGDDRIRWDANDETHAPLLWRTLRAEGRPISKLVFNIGPGAASHDEALAEGASDRAQGPDGVLQTIETVRTLCRLTTTPRFHIQMLLHGGEAASPAASALAGLLRSANLEIPTLSASVAVLPGGQTANATQALAAEAILAGAEPGVTERRWAGNEPLLMTVERAQSPALSRLPVSFTPDDVFVVTGGAGAVGRALCTELAERGVGNLAILGRSESSPAIETLLSELAETGCRTEYLSTDCTDRGSLAAALNEIEASLGRPTGVLHCAGILQDGFFLRQSADDLLSSAQAKIAGAHLLDALTAEADLRWFVLCSGLAGIGGNIGQSHYAFANRWLDGFAERRQAMVERGKRSGRTVSIVWPLWQTSDGMQGSLHLASRLSAAGLESISVDEGRALFMAALAQPTPVTIPVKGDADKLGRFFATTAQPTDEEESSAPRKQAERATSADSASEADVEALVLGLLKDALGEVTGTSAEKIDADAPMEVFGLDSIMVTELGGLLESQFPELSKTAALEARSLRGLAQLIMREHPDESRALLPSSSTADPVTELGEPVAQPSEAGDEAATPAMHQGTRQDTRDGDIAIIGLAGQYPGAETLEEFWDHLAQGHDLVTELPQRWPDDAWPKGTPEDDAIYARWGSFLDDFDKFDPLFFGISPRDAERMDPQERLFLQTAWHAVEDAGYTPETLSGKRGEGRRRRVGVLAGVMYGEYQMYGATDGTDPSIPLTNSSYASIANRVSYCLDLDGPSLAVDSMCSSSLTAIHVACDLIRSKSCDTAIAGGVNLSLHPYKYRTLCELGFASSDGKCRSFGEGGDGYVPGEGVGAVLLKPLRQALADGDHIYAVIKGSDIGHGGRSSGYTVPNGEAQADVISRAFERAGEAGAHVSYVEAHGTGTSLGDPIEIRGLTRALKDKLASTTCPIGSVKSNIGHLESAAGIAAITKVLLQMKHCKIAPSIHSETLNPNIDFARTPFEVQTVLGDWPSRDGASRVAAVSSFGAGGSNAHIVLEEMPATAAPEIRRDGPAVFIFSGRNRQALIRNLDRFARHLEIERQSDARALGAAGYAPEEVAATLLHGRRWLSHRCAVVAQTFPELRDRLAWLLDNLDDAGGDSEPTIAADGAIFIGEVESPALHGEALDGKTTTPEGMAKAWVEGRLEQVTGAPAQLRKVPLPGYAFDKRSFWITDLSNDRQEPGGVEASAQSPAANDPIETAASDFSRPKDPITPELILQKVDRGELDLAAAEAMLESLMEAEEAA